MIYDDNDKEFRFRKQMLYECLEYHSNQELVDMTGLDLDFVREFRKEKGLHNKHGNDE